MNTNPLLHSPPFKSPSLISQPNLIYFLHSFKTLFTIQKRTHSKRSMERSLTNKTQVVRGADVRQSSYGRWCGFEIWEIIPPVSSVLHQVARVTGWPIIAQDPKPLRLPYMPFYYLLTFYSFALSHLALYSFSRCHFICHMFCLWEFQKIVVFF